jgi:hypothetical protein
VASVLSMMFLVMFGSLAAAMAVVAQGNMRTADSALKLSRAMSAAETGLVFAQRRLEVEGARFVIEKGVVNSAFAEDLWLGTYDEGADGSVDVLSPTGYTTTTPPSSLAEAVRDAHLADTHAIVAETGDSSLPAIDETYGTLRVKPIALSDDGANGPYFRLRYELVSGEPAIRVTSIGVDSDITRTLQMDFEITKKIEYAILSPSRVMVGKNVRVEGPLGSRYGLVSGELDSENGDPLVLRSDFYWLDTSLDAALDQFFAAVVDYDVDGDSRLRPGHPVEGNGTGGSLVDYDGDEYVDDFDLFLAAFDANSDKRVVYDASLAAAAGYGTLGEEFVGVDDQLAYLIDSANADRDGDDLITAKDVALGYLDGILDANDTYAKVHGRLAFAVSRSAWEAAHGESFQTIVNGAIYPGYDTAPVSFDVTAEEMREITTDMFSDSQTWFETQVPSGDTNFWSQVGGSGSYTPHPGGGARWEAVPYGSSASYDYYARDVFDGITFRNVRIPKGTNGLFVDCTFIGVTFIETETDNDHPDWNYTDARQEVEVSPGVYDYPQRFPDLQATLGDGSELSPASTRAHSNNIRFHNCTFLGSIAGDRPAEYNHWRNKIQITGTGTRFFTDPNDADILAEADASALISALNSISQTDREELKKSSILMPGWSFDVGNFNNETAAGATKLKLKGTIIAGILDIRGTVDVHGTLLMTYRPTASDGPLFYGGLPDAFNTTIGYFEPEAGGLEGKPLEEIQAQGFGEITLRYNPDALLPDGIPWPITISAQPETYNE